jgi:hypothetical protein
MKCKLVKHISAPVVYNKIPGGECQIENADSQVEFRQKSWEFEPQQKVALESKGMM